jgi:hypothetical protein
MSVKHNWTSLDSPTISCFSILFDKSQITSGLRESSNPDRVGGDIHLIISGCSFPSDRCYDYPVTLLGWWIENCITLNSQSEGIVENCFMDGPYEFWTEKVSETARLKFFRRDIDEDDDDIYVEVLQTYEISFEDYKRELCNAGRKMLRVFDENHVSGEEMENLKSLVENLTKL